MVDIRQWHPVPLLFDLTHDSSLLTIDAAPGTRSYAATAYYAPNVGWPNLTVLTEALVKRL